MKPRDRLYFGIMVIGLLTFFLMANPFPDVTGDGGPVELVPVIMGEMQYTLVRYKSRQIWTVELSLLLASLLWFLDGGFNTKHLKISY